ncbi:MAG: hypothetical protein H6668_08725 [Ardenticatenaceae bacterium]|nr:hypothetical protein [Ardenticatenaceae bacterium]
MFKTSLSIATSLLLILISTSMVLAAPAQAQSGSSGSGLYALLMSTLMTFGLLTVLTILIYRRSD